MKPSTGTFSPSLENVPVITPLKVLNEDACLVMSAANGDDASNPRAKVSELSEKVVDTNPYSRLMCAGRHRHACCAVD